MECSFLQPLKALLAISVTPSGIVTSAKFQQPRNSEPVIFFHFSGIEKEVIYLQPSKILLSIVLIFDGKSNEVIAEYAKAYLPILCEF